MEGWRIQEGAEGPSGVDVSIDVWIEGGKVGGRIVGRVIKDPPGPPILLEEQHDDFLLDTITREALLAEVYRMVGVMPDYAERSSVEPTHFCRWLCGRWAYSRVRALALCMEA